MTQIGYLLPTREAVMEGRDETGPLLAVAERAERLGYDSVWVGDSLFARARHEPLSLLAAAGARTSRVALGTAVLLPALRNPVVLAQQVATVDRICEGRLILGVGIAADHPTVHAEFAAAGVPFGQRVGRLVDGLDLCRALWSGEPVTVDGRYWQVDDVTMRPTPHRPGGPPIWIGGSAPAALRRAGRRYDGWFPTGPDAARFAAGMVAVDDAAAEAGRDPGSVTPAVYLTLAVDDDATRAQSALDAFLSGYYGPAAEVIAKVQACYAGPLGGATDWVREFADAGATHLVLRFAGDHERHLDALAGLRAALA